MSPLRINPLLILPGVSLSCDIAAVRRTLPWGRCIVSVRFFEALLLILTVVFGRAHYLESLLMNLLILTKSQYFPLYAFTLYGIARSYCLQLYLSLISLGLVQI